MNINKTIQVEENEIVAEIEKENVVNEIVTEIVT